MNKALLSIMCLALLLLFIGCGSAKKFDEAKNALDTGDYNTAIAVLDELVKDNYDGSKELLQEAKYQYLKDNLDRKNARAVTYLEELMAENYKDTQAMYEKLYSWKVDIAISTSKQSSVHKDKLNVTSKLFPFYYFNFKTSGGPPNGEYRGKYEVEFSNGQKISDAYVGRDNDFYFAIMLSATETPTGKTTFNVYGENGELLATKTCYIS